MLESQFLNQLSNLDKTQQRWFCLALLQRMSPNYQLFCQAVDWPHEAEFNKLLAMFWEATIFPQTKFNAPVQFERFQELIPNPEEHDSYGVYPASDCCVVAECLFNCLMDFEPSLAEQASQTSLASVLSFLELQFGDVEEQALMEQELVQHELAFQQVLLERVSELKPSKTTLQGLREFASNQGVSNLGIALD